jgi:hypothetical protein
MLTRLSRLLLLALPVKRKRVSVNAVVVNAVANSVAAVEIDVAATGVVVAVTNEAETAGVVVNAVVVAVVVDKRPAQ